MGSRAKREKGSTPAAPQRSAAPSFVMDSKAAKVFLLAAMVALVSIGAVMVYSATSASLSSDGLNPFSDVIRQVEYIGVGLLAMLVIWFAIPYRFWLGSLLWAYYGICMVLLILTFAIGTESGGAKRWIYIGSIGFQPSEFIKIAVLLMAVRIVFDCRVGKIKFQAAVFQFLVFVFLPLLIMLITQSDLGSVAICAVGVYAVLWLGGLPKKWLVVIAVILIAGGLVAIFGVGYRSSRMVFLNPWDDGQGGLDTGYNIIHAYYAIAEGGLFGVGIGSSHEKYDYLFAADSDFIFAIIAEELGMVGALAVIALFLVILFAGLHIALECTDDFGCMVAGGLTIMLVFQAFLNIGCTIGVFPTTGKPLPFISSGGSSVISSLMIIGLILSVARDTEMSRDPRRNRDNLRVVRTGNSAR